MCLKVDIRKFLFYIHFMKNLFRKYCIQCKKEFYVFNYLRNIKHYCCKTCYNFALKYSKKYKKQQTVLGKSNIGKKFTEERKEKQSKIFKRRKFSEDSKKRMSESRIKYLKKNPMKFGKEAHHYKNGRIIRHGYIFILCPNHPNKNNSGYVQEHRLIIEKKIGRFLKKEERVHHKNNIKNDNRPENLICCPNESYHQKIFHKNKIIHTCFH